MAKVVRRRVGSASARCCCCDSGDGTSPALPGTCVRPPRSGRPAGTQQPALGRAAAPTPRRTRTPPPWPARCRTCDASFRAAGRTPAVGPDQTTRWPLSQTLSVASPPQRAHRSSVPLPCWSTKRHRLLQPTGSRSTRRRHQRSAALSPPTAARGGPPRGVENGRAAVVAAGARLPPTACQPPPLWRTTGRDATEAHALRRPHCQCRPCTSAPAPDRDRTRASTHGRSPARNPTPCHCRQSGVLGPRQTCLAPRDDAGAAPATAHAAAGALRTPACAARRRTPPDSGTSPAAFACRSLVPAAAPTTGAAARRRPR